MVDKKFIKEIQGNKFVLFEGLLDEFHNNGGNSIKTCIINQNPLIIQATVEGDKGTFEGMGDADEKNVSSHIALHKIRMAETRAIARALRFYNNIGICSAEELGGEGKPKLTNLGLVCSNKKCKVPVNHQVADYSKRFYGKILCRKCQTLQEKNEEKLEDGMD